MFAAIDPRSLGLGLIVLFLLGVLLAAARWRLASRRGLKPRDPKLVTVGYGGSVVRNVLPDRNLVVTCITVRNEPLSGRGKLLRDPAADCTARLFDPENRKFLGNSLQWRDSASGHFHDRVTLASGEHADLCVFVKAEFSNDYYVFYALSAHTAGPEHLTWVAPDRTRLEVHVTDSTNITHVVEILIGKIRGNHVEIRYPPTAVDRRTRISAAP